MQAVSLAVIARLARTSSGTILCFAGTPVAKLPPRGIIEIIHSSGGGSVHRRRGSGPVPVGLTQIKNSAAFTPPGFQTDTTFRREGPRVDHFATVRATTSQDATHDSFFAAAGLHKQPIVPGERQEHFWEITSELSELIRQGEQEHLDDAQLAYELTYKCVENEINRLVGREFGPASTPYAATQLALDALAQRLPRQLGTDPANWTRMLDAMLSLSARRDTELTHAVEEGNIRQEGRRVIVQLRPSTFFNVGRVPSSQIVHF